MHLAPLALIGKYRVVRLIGDGGMGSVYECRHEALGSRVALKFLHDDLAKRPGLAERFLREARVSATIQSPHVARVMDVDQTPEGAPFFVMELLDGESLQTLLDRTPKLAPEQALAFTQQILLGLDAAHAVGAVHRDIKPDNVFVTRSPDGPLLKIIDFGIAKLKVSPEFPNVLTRAGVVMGTPEYMAPEQLYAASEVDARADIYSVGVMLYEMLCGHRPADGGTPQEIISQVTSGHVRPLKERAPELPVDLTALVHQAMAPNREHRFASAGAMRHALEAYQQQGAYARQEHRHAPNVQEIPSRSVSEITREQTPVLAPPPVARTLPPEGPAVAGAGNTQPEAVPGYHSTEPVPIVSLAQVAVAPFLTGHVSRTQPDRRSAWVWLWLMVPIVILAVAAVFAGIWFDVLENPFEERVPPPLPMPAALPAATTPARASPDTPVPVDVPAEPQTPNQRPRPGTTPKTAHPQTDAGVPTSGLDAGTGIGLPPITLPTAFPPLPQGFPTALPTTLPTELPPLPGFPLPPSKKDAG